ncbi:hypothetical protein TSUD_404710 [Trifolium subterraneum]|uniref:hAT-like transposase RNase-H fold domain-containing protein n=1 Tax=Trifolium subterraneum TaxID=3900 RepID=A0A2Z6NUM1_TRISU|nr:hypothetical protein TSUD_404710 [Trifolium subterraneum]
MDDIDIDTDNESTQNVTPAVNPLGQTKKRKPKANGPRKTSPVWKSFTKLPVSECPEVTAACNYCAVRFVRSSSQRLAKFKECVGFAGITCRKSLCLDVITRWNSTYLMLESAEPFQVAFDKLDFEDPSYLKYFGAGSCPPNFDDWDKARAFMKFLKIFYDATKFFSTSTHVSIGAAFHHLFEIHNDLKLAIRDSDPIISAMGKDMILKYEKYWGFVMKDQNSQEDLDASETIVRELCQSLASTTFGVAGPSTSTSSAGASSSQSRPFGCD